MSDKDAPAPGTPSVAPPVAPPAAPPAAPPPAEPFVSFATSEAFEKRIAQGARKILRDELGIDDIGKLKEQLGRAAEHEKQIEEQRRAQMSTEERLRADAAAAQAAAAQAAAQAAEANHRARVYQLCATKGIKNHAFAEHLLAPHRADTSFDASGYLDQLIADPVQRVALGLEPAAPPPPAPGVRPGQTTPTAPGVPAPAAPTPNGAGAGAVDAMAMTPQQWAEYKASFGR